MGNLKEHTLKKVNNIGISDNRVWPRPTEESPDSIEQRGQITSVERNLKESATENRPPKGKGETVV